MTTIANNVTTIGVDDYATLRQHGFSGSQLPEASRLMAHVADMTEAKGLHVTAIEATLSDLTIGGDASDVPDYAELGKLWGMVDELRQNLGFDMVGTEFTKKNTYRVTVAIDASMSVDTLQYVADFIELINM